MYQFMRALEDELCTRSLNTPDHQVNRPNNELFLLKQYSFETKLPRITAKQIQIRAAKDVKHAMDIDMIFVGYDSDGSHWSDHMGGLRVDCTGLTKIQAIKKISDGIVNHFEEWFKG